MYKKYLLLILTMILLTGCTVKTGQVVILKNKIGDTIVNDPNLNIPIDSILHKARIEKTREKLKDLEPDVYPLAVSADYETVFAYKRNFDNDYGEKNSSVVIGNLYEYVDLFFINLIDKSTTELGTYLSPRDFHFDETGNLFAFIDGMGNVYTYNFEKSILKNVISEDKFPNSTTLSWSRDSKRLMIDTKLNFDLATNEFISTAAVNYTPFIKYKFSDSLYITQMKNHLYNNIISIYNFDNRTYYTLANGTYLDCDGTYLLYTSDNDYNLNILNLKTFENTLVYSGAIYDAQILKFTGEVAYTTIDTTFKGPSKYFAVKYNIETKETAQISLNTCQFYLSPKEDYMYFINDYNVNSYIIDLPSFTPNFKNIKFDTPDVVQIKEQILKMFLLDYDKITSYSTYEEYAKSIYINDDQIFPLQALSNKLVDFGKYGKPLSDKFKAEKTMPTQIKISDLVFDGNYAQVNVGMYYINSIDFIRNSGKWYIAGFSTHIKSEEVAKIRHTVNAYLDKINKNQGNAFDQYGEFNQDWISILTSPSDELTFEIGEVELWMADGTHRSQYATTATSAKVRVNVKSTNGVKTYKLQLKKNGENFEIVGWSTDPLSLSEYN